MGVSPTFCLPDHHLLPDYGPTMLITTRGGRGCCGPVMLRLPCLIMLCTLLHLFHLLHLLHAFHLLLLAPPVPPAASAHLLHLQLVGLVVAFLIIYSYLEEEDACKYLVHTSTYARPLGALSTLPVSRACPPGACVEDGGGTYRPVAMRDSWCIPTYVSYHDSMEWSGSYSSEHAHHHHHHNHNHLHQQQQQQQHGHSPVSDESSLVGAGLNGGERGRHSPSPGLESNCSLSSATTQPYLRLSMTGSDQVQLVES